MLRSVRRGTPVLVAFALLGAGCAAEGTERAERDPAPPAVVASIDGWRWAPRDEPPPRRAEEKPESAPRDEIADVAAEDDATRASGGDGDGGRGGSSRAEADLPKVPPLPDLGGGDDVLSKAEVTKGGIALPPLEAPAEVRAIFEAGNVIARSPYKWGGGHGKWQDTGYDCSGSVSYALAAAGLLRAPMASGPFMKWGKPGRGKWITIYSNPGHMFLVVAGVQFDTSAGKRTGSRWTGNLSSTSGYVARHPEGL